MCNRLHLILIVLLLQMAWSIGWAGECKEDEDALSAVIKDSRNTIDGPFTLEELERGRLITVPETGEEVAFGYTHERWEELKSQLEPGDEIFFISHREHISYFRSGFYVDGLAIVRSGCVVWFLRRKIT